MEKNYQLGMKLNKMKWNRATHSATYLPEQLGLIKTGAILLWLSLLPNYMPVQRFCSMPAAKDMKCKMESRCHTHIYYFNLLYHHQHTHTHTHTQRERERERAKRERRAESREQKEQKKQRERERERIEKGEQN